VRTPRSLHFGLAAHCSWTERIYSGIDGPRDELLGRLQAQDISYLRDLGPAPEGAANRIRYDLHVCRCGATATLTASAVSATLKEGKIKEDSTEILGKLLLHGDGVAALREGSTSAGLTPPSP
jgi:hypothetical protein